MLRRCRAGTIHHSLFSGRSVRSGDPCPPSLSFSLSLRLFPSSDLFLVEDFVLTLSFGVGFDAFAYACNDCLRWSEEEYLECRGILCHSSPLPEMIIDWWTCNSAGITHIVSIMGTSRVLLAPTSDLSAVVHRVSRGINECSPTCGALRDNSFAITGRNPPRILDETLEIILRKFLGRNSRRNSLKRILKMQENFKENDWEIPEKIL